MVHCGHRSGTATRRNVPGRGANNPIDLSNRILAARCACKRSGNGLSASVDSPCGGDNSLGRQDVRPGLLELAHRARRRARPPVRLLPPTSGSSRRTTGCRPRTNTFRSSRTGCFPAPAVPATCPARRGHSALAAAAVEADQGRGDRRRPGDRAAVGAEMRYYFDDSRILSERCSASPSFSSRSDSARPASAVEVRCRSAPRRAGAGGESTERVIASAFVALLGSCICGALVDSGVPFIGSACPVG
jgi:hypothetical protein